MTPYDLKEYDERGRLRKHESRSAVSVITSISAALVVGAASIWGGYGGFGGHGGTGGSEPSPPDTAAPNAPIIQSVFPAVDSVTLKVTLDAVFAGSQGDTQDSIWIMLDSVGKDLTSPLISVKTASSTQRIDTITSASLADGYVAQIVALQHGVNGGWSDTSAAWIRTISYTPPKVTTLSVVAATDTTLTIELVAGHDGAGGVADIEIRYKNITNDTASFVYWETEESASILYDSTTAMSIGDTVQIEIPISIAPTVNLIPGNKYEIGADFYRGVPGNRVVGPIPFSGDNTAIGFTSGGGGGPQGSFAPNEPVGFTKLTDRPFHAVAENGWLHQASGWGSLQIVNDPTAPSGDSLVGGILIPAGATADNYAPPVTWFNFPAGYTEVYAAFWHKVSSNFQGHSSAVNKLFFITDESLPAGGAPLLISTTGIDLGTLQYQIRQSQPSQTNYDANVGDPSLTRNAWQLVEVYAKMNTDSATSDGILRVWVDSTKTHEYTNVLWSDQTRQWTTAKYEPVWGETGDLVEADMWHYMDRLYVSVGGFVQDPVKPTLILTSVGLDTVQFNGSGFSGTLPHDSTRYILSANQDLSSPVLDVWSSTNKTSYQYVNAAMTDGGTYYGGIVYAGAAGVSDTSIVQSVINAAPPGGDCTWCPNEPSGMTTLTNRQFNTYTDPGWWGASGYGTFPVVNSSSELILVNDPTAPSQSDSVWRNLLPNGWVSGGETLVTGHEFGNYKTVYVAMQLKLSSNYVANPAGNKIGFVNEDFPGFPAILSMAGGSLEPGGQYLNPPFIIRLGLQGAEGGGALVNRNLDQQTFSQLINPGQWVTLEYLLIQNSADDVADGSWYGYINGVLVAEYHDIRYGNLNQVFNAVKINWNWGGQGYTTDRDSYIYWDRWYTSAKN